MRANISKDKSYSYLHTMTKERLEYIKTYSNDIEEALKIFEAETALIARYLMDRYYRDPKIFRYVYHKTFVGKSPANYKLFVDSLVVNKAPKIKQLKMRKVLYYAFNTPTN